MTAGLELGTYCITISIQCKLYQALQLASCHMCPLFSLDNLNIRIWQWRYCYIGNTWMCPWPDVSSAQTLFLMAQCVQTLTLTPTAQQLCVQTLSVKVWCVQTLSLVVQYVQTLTLHCGHGYIGSWTCWVMDTFSRSRNISISLWKRGLTDTVLDTTQARNKTLSLFCTVCH